VGPKACLDAIIITGEEYKLQAPLCAILSSLPILPPLRSIYSPQKINHGIKIIFNTLQYDENDWVSIRCNKNELQRSM
jgi:hypothetical protein